jgi:ankyrin repeat protein
MVWGHSQSGYNLNSNTDGVVVKNCTAWNNSTNYALNYWRASETGRKKCVLTNTISLDGREGIHREAISKNNSWNSDLNLELTDSDFLSLDDSKMSALRNPDGSIPYNNFLRLAPDSAAIDAGIDVNMPYIGKAPDLGAFEYDPDEKSKDYVKMLHQAVRDHNVEEINKLLAAGEGINDKDWLGYTPLHWAVYFGYSDLIELLISKGADPNIQSDTGRYALEIARSMVCPELEALLRKLGGTKEASQ